MKDMERDLFWLDLGPAAEYAGMPCADTAAQGGDASPDGQRHGFDGAEPGIAQNDSQNGRTAGSETDSSAENGCGCGRPEAAQPGSRPETPRSPDDLFLPEPPDIFPRL